MDLGLADIGVIAASVMLLGGSVLGGLRLLRESNESEPGLSDGAVLLAESGRVHRQNCEALRRLGDTRGLSLTDLLAGWLGDGRDEVMAAVERLLRYGEPMHLLATDRDGRAFELAGRPEGAAVRLVLREAELIEQRVREDEARLAEREARIAARALEHETLTALVAQAPLVVWNRRLDGEVRWGGGAIHSDAGSVGAGEVIAALSGPGAHRPPSDAAGVERRRIEVALGAEEHLALHVVEVPAPDGGCIGYAVDASVAASAERTLSRFVQTMTETFAHLTVGLAIFDRNKTLALFNPALVQMWQLDASWLARRPSLREIIEALRAGRRIPDVADFHGWRSRLLALFDDAEQADYEELWHLGDGSNFRVLARPHPHGSIAFVFDDVTEQMRLEQRFRHSIELRRATINRMEEGLAVFRPDGMLQFVNAAFHRFWNTEPETLGPAPHAREVLRLCAHASVETDVWERMMRFITADDSRDSWSTRLTLGSGRVLNARIAALPDGSSMLLFADITDSERIAAALRERNEALEAAEEMRSAVLDQLSHRLRTPLNTVFGFAQLLSDSRFGELTDRQRDYASGILEAAGQLLDTIDDVTELADLRIDPLHDEETPHRVWEVLELTVGLLRKRAITAGKTLKVDDPPDGAASISCDMPSLRQLTFSIAAEALHRGGPGREIVLGARAEGADLVIYTRESGGQAQAPSPEGDHVAGPSGALLTRMALRAGGSYRLVHDRDNGEIAAICRFPGVLQAAEADPEDEDEAVLDETEEELVRPGAAVPASGEGHGE